MTIDEWMATKQADIEKYRRAAQEIKRALDREQHRYLDALGRFHEAVTREYADTGRGRDAD